MDKFLGTLSWFLIAMPIGALIQASAISKLWAWFLSAQYGPGPTLGAWFGVSVIVTVLTRHLAPKEVPGVTDAKATSDITLSKLVGCTLESWVLLGVTLLIALGVGSAFGWIR